MLNKYLLTNCQRPLQRFSAASLRRKRQVRAGGPSVTVGSCEQSQGYGPDQRQMGGKRRIASFSLAGHETKAMLNNSGPRYKRSKIERRMNTDIFFCIGLLFLMCLIGAVGMGCSGKNNIQCYSHLLILWANCFNSLSLSFLIL